MSLSLVWFRRDLRLHDHPALTQACRLGPVLPLFVLDPALLHHPETGVARVAFLLESLRALDLDLRRRGGRLLVRCGDPLTVIDQMVRACRVERLFAHVDAERIVGRVRDARLARHLAAAGIPLHWVEPPGGTGDLLPYPDFRRFWQRAMAEAPLPQPQRVPVPPPDPQQPALEDRPVPTLEELGLCHDGKPLPPAGTAAALARLQRFQRGPSARTYHWQLSQPAARASTGLSPYLKFGVVTARQCLAELAPMAAAEPALRRSWEQLVSRLRWGAGMAQRFRYLPQLELRSLWSGFDPPGEELTPAQEELYQAWCEGQTGFPFIDATARALRAEGGWQELNFRSRAISASFLTHLCGIDWRYGALHFMRHLLDGDCPIDHYQWALQAGVVPAGAAGWSRIYHPGQVAVDRCDPQGRFLRRWLPELAHLTNDQLGSPPPQRHYPPPILDYATARRRRLEQLERWRDQLPALPRSGASGAWIERIAPLPSRPLPFAAGRFPGAVVAWAEMAGALLPPPLPLEALDGGQRAALASWFQAGGRSTARPAGTSSRSTKSKTGRGRGRGFGEAVQLGLFDQA
ncbi:MAG: FAD-binding domain-containing protein [Prochlorococcaceae cyanobacterium]